MRNCFIPHCDANSRRLSIKRRMMFQPPKDDDLFMKWCEVLPKQRPFKKKDLVCQLHFREDDIITTWDYIINGNVESLDRAKPKLKPMVIPSLNLPDPNTFTVYPISVNRIKTKNGRKRPLVVCEEPEDEIEFDFDLNECKQPEESIEIEEIDESESTETITGDTRVLSEEDVPVQPIDGNFDTIYDDIYDVTLPNTLWAIHRDPDRQHIIFSYIDIDLMQSTKLFTINSKYISKIYLHNQCFERTTISDLSIDFLSDKLSEIDTFRLCKRYGQNECCEILSVENSEFCIICKQMRSE